MSALLNFERLNTTLVEVAGNDRRQEDKHELEQKRKGNLKKLGTLLESTNEI